MSIVVTLLLLLTYNENLHGSDDVHGSSDRCALREKWVYFKSAFSTAAKKVNSFCDILIISCQIN
jgi:hypothetical protein